MCKKILLFLFLFFLAACATTDSYQQALNQWRGQSWQTLVKAWGYPEAGIKLPNGNTVYTYLRQQLYTAPTYPITGPVVASITSSTVTSSSVLPPYSVQQPTILYCRTWFEVSPQGVIINTQFQGNNCVARRF